MTSQRPPLLSITLVMVVIALHFLVNDKTLLYFSTAAISQGETWRLITGHFMHADVQHLLWNCLGLAVLASMIERHSKAALWTALSVGIVSVNILLLTPLAQLDYYCGLSGVLNTLLLVALWFEWTVSRSWLIIAIGIGGILKACIEVSLGASVVTQISWPPYAWSHVAGLVGGFLLILVMALATRPSYPRPGFMHRVRSNTRSESLTH